MLARRLLRFFAMGRGRVPALTLLALCASALCFPESPLVRATRFGLFSRYQILFPREPSPAPVLRVQIDDASIRRHGQWAWPRTRTAELLSRILEGRPAALGVFLLFSEPDRLSPSNYAKHLPDDLESLRSALEKIPPNDSILAARLKGFPVVLGILGQQETGNAKTSTDLPRCAEFRVSGPNPKEKMIQYLGAIPNLPEIAQAAAGLSNFHTPFDYGALFRFSLASVVANTLCPGFAAELFRVAEEQRSFELHSDTRGVSGLSIGSHFFPSDSDGRVWLHYGPADPEKKVSAQDVLNGTVPASRFAHRFVLVGATASGIGEQRTAPSQELVQSMELQAQALENLLEHEYLLRPSWTPRLEALLLLILGGLLVWLTPLVQARYSLLIWLSGTGFLGALGVLAFLEAGVLVDVASPAIGLATVFGAVTVGGFSAAEQQKRRLEHDLARERETTARIEGELAAARSIQMGLLPPPSFEMGSGQARLHAFMEPAKEVGGDLYDYCLLDDDRLLFLVGDVSGKGLPASLFMAVSKSMFKSIASRGFSGLEQVVRDANTEVGRENPERLFVTLFAGVLDTRTGEVEYCNAGHHKPFVISSGAATLDQLRGVNGPPLCMEASPTYTATRVRLNPGETLCLMTDGVTEATNAADEMFGRHRLREALEQVPALSDPAAVVEHLRRRLKLFVGGASPADDITIMALRWEGPGGTA